MTDIRPFATTADGRQVDLIVLRAGALRVHLLTWGAVLHDVRLAGVPHSLTLGTDVFAAYEDRMGWFGAVVGPVANRIARAEATIGGRAYRFAANEGTTLLHGGTTGTSAQLWQVVAAGADAATLCLDLPDGFGGFPGNRTITAAFRLEPPARLRLTLGATTDAPTLMNLAPHHYWNLDGRPDISGHRLRIAADHYLPVDAATLPTGEIREVAGSPFDLRAGGPLRLDAGYDHNFCLAPARRALTDVAEVTGATGVRLRIATTEPGLQVFDGARMGTAPYPGHSGVPYGPHGGLALEPQLWPDAVHHAGFPPVTLAQGEGYEAVTDYRFDRV